MPNNVQILVFCQCSPKNIKTQATEPQNACYEGAAVRCLRHCELEFQDVDTPPFLISIEVPVFPSVGRRDKRLGFALLANAEFFFEVMQNGISNA